MDKRWQTLDSFPLGFLSTDAEETFMYQRSILCTLHIAVDFKFVLYKELFRDERGGGWVQSITINVPVVYMAPNLMILMRATSITRSIRSGGL